MRQMLGKFIAAKCSINYIKPLRVIFKIDLFLAND